MESESSDGVESVVSEDLQSDLPSSADSPPSEAELVEEFEDSDHADEHGSHEARSPFVSCASRRRSQDGTNECLEN